MTQRTDDEKNLWYKEGLHFKCTGCGDCCTGAPGYVWLKEFEIQAIAAEMNLEVPTFVKLYVRKVGARRSLVEYDNGDCVFFDTKSRKCTIYDSRPEQCRTWPFWDSNLKTPETWAEACRDCPGSGEGKLYQLEEIKKQAKVVHV